MLAQPAPVIAHNDYMSGLPIGTGIGFVTYILVDLVAKVFKTGKLGNWFNQSSWPQTTQKFVIAIGETSMNASNPSCTSVRRDVRQQRNRDSLRDTDQENGNKSCVENLVQNYIRIKSEHQKEDGGRPNVNTFFSAKLNLYRFWTDYQDKNFKKLSKLGAGVLIQERTTGC